MLSSSTLPWLVQVLCGEYYYSNQNLSLFVPHVLDAPDLLDCKHEADKELYDLIVAFVTHGSLPTVPKVTPKEVLAHLAERAKHIKIPAGVTIPQIAHNHDQPALVQNFGYSDIVEAAVAQAPKIQLHAFMVICACFHVLSRGGSDDDGPILPAILAAYLKIWDQIAEMEIWDEISTHR